MALWAKIKGCSHVGHWLLKELFWNGIWQSCRCRSSAGPLPFCCLSLPPHWIHFVSLFLHLPDLKFAWHQTLLNTLLASQQETNSISSNLITSGSEDCSSRRLVSEELLRELSSRDKNLQKGGRNCDSDTAERKWAQSHVSTLNKFAILGKKCSFSWVNLPLLPYSHRVWKVV